MDFTLHWSINSNVETLVHSIVECKKQLSEVCREKFGSAQFELLSCDAFAGGKLLKFLELSELWRDATEDEEVSSTVPAWRKQKKSTKLLADFALFKLHRSNVMGDDQIRVVSVYKVADCSAEQMFFATIRVD